MKILIFDWTVEGHHLEYLHHLYKIAVERKSEKFVFLVPTTFDGVKDKFYWEPTDNVEFRYITEEERLQCENPKLLKAAWFKSKVVSKRVKNLEIDKVWLIVLMHFMPFLPLVLPNSVKVSGVLYRIYFYEGSAIRGVRLWIERLRYKLMVWNKSIDKVLVLNDQWATDELNRIYNTDKFTYLPDPVPEIDDSKVHNIREELGVSETDKVFLHFGGLDERKGTLEILKAIGLLDGSALTDKVFVFAGRVNKEIKEEFYNLKKTVDGKVRIIVYDEFCSYEHLHNLCNSCDCVLIPYKNPNQSSGVIGYASHFGKPVLGPNKGLLGRLVNDYGMGQGIDDVSYTGMTEAITNFKNADLSDKYSKTHSVSDFNDVFELTLN